MTDEDKKQSYLPDDLDLDGNQEEKDIEIEELPSSASVEEAETSIFDEEEQKEELEDSSSLDTDQLQIEEDPKDESVSIQKSKVVLIKKLLENIKENNDQVTKLLAGLVNDEDERIAISQIGENKVTSAGLGQSDDEDEVEGKIVEGVFDGENMIGPDGKQYSVPANYASKSKLVEGDILKLTITHSGTFVYKQIGPIERVRAVGILERDDEANCFVIADGKKWRVLPASVTYFKGDLGDEVVLLVPKTGESKWGAVENIIKKPQN